MGLTLLIIVALNLSLFLHNNAVENVNAIHSSNCESESYRDPKGFKGSRCRVIKLCFIAEIEILLFRAGVELNPGPGSRPNPPLTFPEFSIISQNCRGLTDCKNACKFMKKVSSFQAPPTFICTQETHCINGFVLDNFYKGLHVIDDGDRNQRGVSILIPEGTGLCTSSRF